MTTYHVSPHVQFRSLQDEVILLDVRDETYLGLNRTGATIWQTISDGGTLADAISALSARFETTRENAERDVNAFVRELTQRGLIEVNEAATQ